MTEPCLLHGDAPPALRAGLLTGSTGRLHLERLAGEALAAGSMDLAWALARDAWGGSPLDGDFAATLLATPALAPYLDEPVRAALQALVDGWAPPTEAAYYQRLHQRRDMDRLRVYLDRQLEDGSLFWLGQALALALVEGDWPWAEALLARPLPGALEPCVAGLRAQVALLAGEPGKALDLLPEAGRLFGPGWTAWRSGLAAKAAGQRDTALEHLRAAWDDGRWRVNAALIAHDLAAGVDRAAEPLPGSVCVALYSWNKAHELERTLAALAASDLEGGAEGGVRILALDNGSDDATGEVLARWARELGGRMEVITLPVNVGAAAARNWIMHTDTAKAADFLAYLDDDVDVPADWLARLGAGVARYPHAGVWGCKVVDADNAALVQSVDQHLQLPDAADGSGVDLTRSDPGAAQLTNLHVQGLDCGEFDFLRPCASVTGCCHLFRTGTLLEQGGFALQLMPSQYDDMEHDLRLCEAGRFPACTGHLRLPHHQRTGAASRTSGRKEANAIGNRYKMLAMHPPADLAPAAEAEVRLLAEDFSAKLERLDR